MKMPGAAVTSIAFYLASSFISVVVNSSKVYAQHLTGVVHVTPSTRDGSTVTVTWLRNRPREIPVAHIADFLVDLLDRIVFGEKGI